LAENAKMTQKKKNRNEMKEKKASGDEYSKMTQHNIKNIVTKGLT
jgi:hypothetical protein